MPSEISLEQSSFMKWTLHQTVSLNLGACHICHINNHLYACQSCRIDLYTTSLHRVETINAGDMGWVRCV